MATLSKGEVFALAVIVGMKEPKTMAAIAMAESSGRTDVVNSIKCVGLWQINQPVHVKANPTWTIEWLQNPFNNARAAKKIQDQSGLGAWEAYTGPDGKGSDGPWRKFENSDEGDDKFTASDVGMTQEQFDKALEGSPGVAEQPDLSDSPFDNPLSGVTDVLTDVWESITTPALWMRLAYGLTGVVLVAGGLFLVVRNTPAAKAVGSVAKATPVGRVAAVAKGGSK